MRSNFALLSGYIIEQDDLHSDACDSGLSWKEINNVFPTWAKTRTRAFLSETVSEKISYTLLGNNLCRSVPTHSSCSNLDLILVAALVKSSSDLDLFSVVELHEAFETTRSDLILINS